MGCHDKELSVVFMDDAHMAELNFRYLGRNGPTNVLAFPMREADPPEGGTPGVETELLGDVVISLDTAGREAEELGETLEQRVDRLLIHGVLHLLGHDHEGPEDEAARMENEEERLMLLIREEDGIWHG